MGNSVNKSYQNIISAAALTAAMVAPAATMAGEVTLKSADGTVNLVGEFVDFNDNNYVIRTALGELRIAASRVSCEGDDCPTFGTAEADINIAGSDTVGLGVMPLLLSGYGAHLNAEATQTATATDGQFITEMVGDEGFGDVLGSYLVTSTGSSDAFSTLLDRSAQVGMASRRIKPTEARALRADGAGNMVSIDSEHIIAVDSLVVITHPSNPVKSVTMDQLRGIFSGAISNWAELGGDDAPITLVDRASDSGTRSVFMSGLYGDEAPAPLSDTIVVPGNNEMAALVNADETAIGFVGYAFQRGASALTLVNDCGITMTPDAFSARTQEYALQRLLYLYTRDDTVDAETMDFIHYAESKAADEVIAKAGFIDLGIDRRGQTLDSGRAHALLSPDVDAYEAGFMREMLSQMVDYDRLSTTFRFRTGSQNLDERGMLNLERLTDYLETQPEGTKVLFVGFTDDVGAFDSNRALSQSRAAQVRAELQNLAGERLAGIEMDTSGYGEISPSACNNTENERQINRRVEVWIEAANG
jgi:phosphate transport system substrate-binding protein